MFVCYLQQAKTGKIAKSDLPGNVGDGPEISNDVRSRGEFLNGGFSVLIITQTSP